MSDAGHSANDARAADATKSLPPVNAPRLDWKTRAAISIGGFIIRTLARSWRFRVEGREAVEVVRRTGQGVIFTFWHGQMLPLLAEHHRPTTVLISDHRDGEIITQIVRSFGCRAIRGSSSKGAARALLQLSRTLNEGNDIAITPDGPRGPRHSFASGAVVLSQRTGAPIALLSCHASRVWRLKTWDQFELPKPFAKITMLYGEPFVVSADRARDAVTEIDSVAAALIELGKRADAIAVGAISMKA